MVAEDLLGTAHRTTSAVLEHETSRRLSPSSSCRGLRPARAPLHAFARAWDVRSTPSSGG